METDRTPPDQSAALDALVKEILDMNQRSSARWYWWERPAVHIEYAMRRAFKLAVDTELQALSELYDKLMSGMQRKHREAMLEFDQAFTRSRTWVKVQPQPDSYQHQVPPTRG